MSTAGNVLVIDHDAARARLLAMLVEDVGFSANVTTELSNVEQTLRDHDDIDVILCDMDMPGLDWDESRRSLKEADSRIPVILFSEWGEAERMMKALRFGASDFFVHPIDDAEALHRSLERCIRQRAVLRELQRSQHSLEQANLELRATVKVLQQDQQAGRQVQMRMLPGSPLEVGDYTFTHQIIPSLYLSGDFTDYFTVGDHCVTFVMADVSGHGSSSAFTTVLLKNLFARKRSDFYRQHDDTILNPVAMLRRANREIKDLAVGKFATMVVGVLDVTTDTLRYSTAGHLPQPVLASREGVQYLPGEGSAVGILEEPEFHEQRVELPRDSLLALFSDGILETLAPRNLVDKEAYFLNEFKGGVTNPEKVTERLGLDRVEAAPDDIAALFIRKRG